MLGKAEYIGVDIGHYAVKIARVKKSGKSFTASGLAYEILPESLQGGRYTAEMRELITNLLKFNKITKGQPVIHINSGDSIMRNVVVPEGTKKDMLEGAIEVDLGPALPFGLDQVYYDFDETPDASGAHLTVAARRDLVDDRTKLFADRPKTLAAPEVDVDVFAYERLVENLTDSGTISASTVAVFDIGFKRSRFMIYQDKRFIFVREPQIGGHQATEIVRDTYDIDLQEAESRKLNQNLGDEYFNLVVQPYANSLSEQINLAVDFYDAGNPDASPVEVIYLTGGGALLKDLVPALSEKISIPLEILDLSHHIKLSGKQAAIHQSGLSHSLAIALAMEGK